METILGDNPDVRVSRCVLRHWKSPYVVLIFYYLVVMKIQSCYQCAQKSCVGDNSMGPRDPFSRESKDDTAFSIF